MKKYINGFLTICFLSLFVLISVNFYSIFTDIREKQNMIIESVQKIVEENNPVLNKVIEIEDEIISIKEEVSVLENKSEEISEISEELQKLMESVEELNRLCAVNRNRIYTMMIDQNYTIVEAFNETNASPESIQEYSEYLANLILHNKEGREVAVEPSPEPEIKEAIILKENDSEKIRVKKDYFFIIKPWKWF